MGELVKFVPKSNTPYRWEYSLKAQKRETFFDRVEQEAFNVLTTVAAAAALSSWTGIQNTIDAKTAWDFWWMSTLHLIFQFKGLKWTTRFDDEGKRWTGGSEAMTLGEAFHFRTIEYPDEK